MIHTVKKTQGTSLCLVLCKAIPEPKGLVTGTSDNDLTIRAHGEIQNPVSVTSEGDDLLHARVLPNDDLVLAVAVGGNDLVRVLGPSKVTDLRASIDLICGNSTERVPELDTAISSTTTGSKGSTGVGRPGDRLDRSRMFVKFVQWGGVGFVPDVETIVVTT